MRAHAGVAALLLLAACHPAAPGVTLDADEDARNATAAKIAADLAAADQAARTPLPHAATPRPAERAEEAPDAMEDDNPVAENAD